MDGQKRHERPFPTSRNLCAIAYAGASMLFQPRSTTVLLDADASSGMIPKSGLRRAPKPSKAPSGRCRGHMRSRCAKWSRRRCAYRPL